MSTAFYVSYGVLWVLVIVLSILLLLVYRHFGMMALGTIQGVQRDGIPIGESAPDITATTPSGRELVLKPGSEGPSLVLFASPECEPCAVVLPYLNNFVGRASAPELMTVVPGPAAVAERMGADHKLIYECYAEDGSGAFDAYRVRVTPFAFVVGSDGRVLAKGLCSEPVMLRDLLAAAGIDKEVVPETLQMASSPPDREEALP
jgi:thiol-disulfide isomerase/thioredoxin